MDPARTAGLFAKNQNPYALSQVIQELGLADPSRIGDLERRLVEILKTTDRTDVVFHRTRVHGLR